MTFTAASDADVLQALSQQHQRLLALLDEAFAATGAARYRTVAQLAARLLAHLDAEHRVLDPVVRERLDGGRHLLSALGQYEKGMRSTLRRLQALGDYAEDYADVLTCFETSLLGHVAVSDSELFPALREVVEPAERHRLGAALRSAGAVGRPVRRPLGFLRAS